MQYKKKYINDKILEAGRQEYLEKGFRAGNISTIATNAGVPVGNLYRYFDGKSGLLDAIVKPAYLDIPKIIKRLSVMKVENATLEQLIEIIAEELIRIFDDYGKELLILVDKCASTRYEDFYDQITALVAQIVFEQLYASTDAADELMAQLIAKAFINSIFDILRLNLEREKMRVALYRIMKFYFLSAQDRK